MSIKTFNPSNGALLKTHRAHSESDVVEILESVRKESDNWATQSIEKRSSCFNLLARILRSNAHTYAECMAKEMGKPLDQGIAEIEKSAWVCEYYAQHAEEMLTRKNIPTEARESFVSYQPLGTVFAIMPWNFPFWQVFRAAAPSMIAGNGLVLKHSSLVPECALTIESIFKEAGFPNNIFRTLLIKGKAAAQIISHPTIQAITFTGSTQIGAQLAAEAGKNLKKSVLELGGSDPYLILEDADIASAANLCATARMINGGQSCIAAKRFIVIESVRKSFESFLVEEMRSYIPGDPLKTGTRLGPMANIPARNELHQQIQESIRLGAKLLLGGIVPQNEGAYYPPTVLTNITKKMPLYNEETFGPVAAIISANNEEEAINIANDTPFGLGAAIFTKDIERTKHIAEKKLNVGTCAINDFVCSDPRLPFGGVKKSGYGRELGDFGICEFVNIKTIVIQ